MDGVNSFNNMVDNWSWPQLVLGANMEIVLDTVATSTVLKLKVVVIFFFQKCPEREIWGWFDFIWQCWTNIRKEVIKFICYILLVRNLITIYDKIIWKFLFDLFPTKNVVYRLPRFPRVKLKLFELVMVVCFLC